MDNFTTKRLYSDLIDVSNPEIYKTNTIEFIFDMVFMEIFGLLGVAFGVTGLFVVRKNSILKGIIEHYAFIDLSNFIIINASHVIWAVPSAIWHVNETVPWLDNIIAGAAFTAISIGFPPKLFLGLNRFCALAFEGHFYKTFEKTKPLQYFLMFIYPLMTAIAFAVPGCHCIFVAYLANTFYVEDGESGQMMIYITQVLPCYTIVPLQTFLDCSVFYLMRKRLRNLQNARSSVSNHQAMQIRREMRLATQMITNLIAGLIMTTSILTTYMGEDIHFSTFSTFILFTALWLISTLIPCIFYVVLLREKKMPRNSITIVSLSNAQLMERNGSVQGVLSKVLISTQIATQNQKN